MKEKRIILLIFSLILIASFFINISLISAEINETLEAEQINKAYDWLYGELENETDWDRLPVEEISLAILALAHDSRLSSIGKNVLMDKSKNNGECWPTFCKVKDTSMAILALDRICLDADEAEEWLLLQNSTPTGLIWYLQIDSDEATNCSISYYEKEFNIEIGEDKKLSSDAGSCLSRAYSNYWYKIAPSCYDREYTISCDQDFSVSLLYQQITSSTIYVSSDTKTSAAGGSASIKINSICLKDTSCNYEATSWAALTLTQKGFDISMFLPYLVSYAEQNERYLPEAFLLLLTGNQDYANQLLDLQKTVGYWEAESSAHGKYYDTALALLSLKNYESEKIDKAKEWLLNEQSTRGDTEGSWKGKKKDTSMVLFSVWPKTPSCYDAEDLFCEDYDYYCVPPSDCDDEDILSDYLCYGADVCCNIEPELKDCSDLGGVICSSSEECIGGYFISSSDDYCCADGYCGSSSENNCENIGYDCQYSYCEDDYEEVENLNSYCEDDYGSNYICCKPESITTNECVDAGGICKSLCDEDIEYPDYDYECPDSFDYCCITFYVPPEEGSLLWLWIIIIIIVIVLIFFLIKRGKLRFRKRKFKFKPGEGPFRPSGPPPRMPPMRARGPPSIMMPRRPPLRPIPSRRMRYLTPISLPPKKPAEEPMPLRKPKVKVRTSKRKTKTDKDLEAVLKKLKKISKKEKD